MPSAIGGARSRWRGRWSSLDPDPLALTRHLIQPLVVSAMSSKVSSSSTSCSYPALHQDRAYGRLFVRFFFSSRGEVDSASQTTMQG